MSNKYLEKVAEIEERREMEKEASGTLAALGIAGLGAGLAGLNAWNNTRIINKQKKLAAQGKFKGNPNITPGLAKDRQSYGYSKSSPLHVGKDHGPVKAPKVKAPTPKAPKGGLGKLVGAAKKAF